MGLCHGKRVGEYRQGRIPENPSRASRQPLRPAHAGCCHSQTQSRPSSASPASPVPVSPSTLKNARYMPVGRVCVIRQPLAKRDRQEYSHSARRGLRSGPSPYRVECRASPVRDRPRQHSQSIQSKVADPYCKPLSPARAPRQAYWPSHRNSQYLGGAEYAVDRPPQPGKHPGSLWLPVVAHHPYHPDRRSAQTYLLGSLQSAGEPPRQTSHTSLAQYPVSQYKSTSQPSSVRTWSALEPPGGETHPSYPSGARGWSSRSRLAAHWEMCEKYPPVFQTVPAASHRSPDHAENVQWHQKQPKNEPPALSRHTPQAHLDVRPHPDQDCSSAYVKQLPAASLYS